MGIPLVSYCVSLPRPVFLFVKYFCQFKSAIFLVFSSLGRSNTSNNRSRRHRVPVREELPPPSLIKSELRSIVFASFSERDNHVCTVCLESFDRCDEVRELGNCHHAFHKDCIDQWIDVGQVTCPLCRARLLPSKQIENRVMRLVFGNFLTKRSTRS